MWFRFDCGYGFERQICISEHLIKYFSESIFQGQVCKPKGRRKLERGPEHMLLSCGGWSLSSPTLVGVGGGSAGGSMDLRDLCPAHRIHIDDFPWHKFEKVIMSLT